MSKLNVKVIDMKDGEVTKISYEGVEYTKVETEAMSGDIIRYIDDYEDTPSTDFFKVKGDQYVDNSGTTLSINGWGGHLKYTTFRNLGKQIDIEDRFSALETRVGAIEKFLGDGDLSLIKAGREPGEFKKGDIVRVKDACGAPLSPGDLCEVKCDSTGMDVVHVTERGWAVSVDKLIAPVDARVDGDE